MTPGGWIFMIGSVGFVTFLMAWTIYKVVSTPRSTEHMHSQIDIDTRDRDT